MSFNFSLAQVRSVPRAVRAGGLLVTLATLISACSASSGGKSTGPAGAAGYGGTFDPGSAGGGYNPGGGEGPLPMFNSGGAPVSIFAGGSAGVVGAGGAGPVLPPEDQPIVIDETPGPLDPGTVAALEGAAGTASGVQLLYPYDGTVFPVGLLAPLMQWSQSGSVDGIYLHMKSQLFEYKGAFAGNTAMQLPIPEEAWKKAGQQTLGATDPLTVELVVKSGGNVVGTKEQLVFAPGKLKGDVFYNTYTSLIAQKISGAPNGAVMKLKLGAPAPDVLLTDVGAAPIGPCWSCHSLSANGNTLVAQHHNYTPLLAEYRSASFDLRANPGLSPPPKAQMPSSTAEMGLGAVYPDGTKVLTMGSPGNSATASLNPFFPDATGNVPAMIGTKESMLLDTSTGNPITMNGFGVKYAKMPSFSPDGSKVVFNWHEDSDGHSLAIADFDSATNTFSNVHQIYKNDTLYPGWPFITPDNLEVVFALGNKTDYVSAYPGRLDVASSDLWVVDIATKAARPLARANGYMTDGAPTYLPKPGRDEHTSFFPTITPIQAGGYFWVFFTSRRTYGNVITAPNDTTHAEVKKIWVSAFNIRDGALIQDPSNPPFYLPGQEAESGNIRVFAALEPCHADGGDCETGVDCCGGHCYMGKCQLPPPPVVPPGEPPPPPACSNIDEACAIASDCCDAKAKCIRSFCGIVQPPR